MITLPLPPSINHCYRRHTLKTGQRINVLTREAEMWRTQAAIQVAAWARDEATPPDPLTADQWVIGMRVFWPDKRRRDADNLMKLILDAVKEGTGVDDSRMLPQVWRVAVDRERPRVEVDIASTHHIRIRRYVRHQNCLTSQHHWEEVVG